jgi:hypothetical protein
MENKMLKYSLVGLFVLTLLNCTLIHKHNHQLPDKSNFINFSISLDKQALTNGNVHVILHIKNISPQSLDIVEPINYGYVIFVYCKDSSGNDVGRLQIFEPNHNVKFRIIAPGEQYDANLIYDLRELYDLKTGIYSIKAVYHCGVANIDRQTISSVDDMYSNEIVFKIP